VFLLGAALGLIAPLVVLTLLWFGLGFGVKVGNVNLADLLWPSNVMLLVGWHTTIPGVFTTVLSVLINCFLYSTVAVLLRELILALANGGISAGRHSK
jgi:hypothetical protein